MWRQPARRAGPEGPEDHFSDGRWNWWLRGWAASSSASTIARAGGDDPAPNPAPGFTSDQLRRGRHSPFPPVTLLDVRRLRLRLLDLFHRLGASLVDVEGELNVVVVDPNAIVRLQCPAQEQP